METAIAKATQFCAEHCKALRELGEQAQEATRAASGMIGKLWGAVTSAVVTVEDVPNAQQPSAEVELQTGAEVKKLEALLKTLEGKPIRERLLYIARTSPRARFSRRRSAAASRHHAYRGGSRRAHGHQPVVGANLRA